MIAEGASFAVENWAAAGFWQELEDGLLKHQAGAASPACGWRSSPGTTASRASTPATSWRSWRTPTSTEHFDQDKFFKGGQEILDAVAVFWDGLEEDRKAKRYLL